MDFRKNSLKIRIKNRFRASHFSFLFLKGGPSGQGEAVILGPEIGVARSRGGDCAQSTAGSDWSNAEIEALDNALSEF
jgi:hypothetical protein